MTATQKKSILGPLAVIMLASSLLLLSTPPAGATDPAATVYVSSTTGGRVDGISFGDEDILAHDTATDTWAMYFDGSDVGLAANDVDAFHILDDGDLLLSLLKPQTVGYNVDDSDIIRFTPTSLGANTAGTFSLYFDGSDVGLTTGGEDIDAISLAPDGRLLVSTLGSSEVFGTGGTLQSDDEDLLVFTGTLGPSTSGNWEHYFDGSDVGLNKRTENVTGTSVDPASGEVYLATRGRYSVTGLKGRHGIFVFSPTSLGSTTTGTFEQFSRSNRLERLDGIFIDPS